MDISARTRACRTARLCDKFLASKTSPILLTLAMDRYKDVPVEISSPFDTSSLKGKSVLITGGANGLGKAYAQNFVRCGAYVTIVDFDRAAGQATVDELQSNDHGSNTQFQECDVTNWDQLVQAFEAATRNSPNKGLDIVIANAAIGAKDDLFVLEDPIKPPTKPNLKQMEVNLTGVLYTTKLAFHYLRRQPIQADRDRCLILKSSLAGYLDLPGSVQYNCSKFGVRGLFRCLRQTSLKEGIRINIVAPWFAQTQMLPRVIENHLNENDIGLALVEDCCRALGVVPRQRHVEGVMDLGLDDFPPRTKYWDMQRIVLEVTETVTGQGR